MVDFISVVVINVFKSNSRKIVKIFSFLYFFLRAQLSRESLALSVESINFMIIVVIECFVREILARTIHAQIIFLNLRDNVVLLNRVYELVML